MSILFSHACRMAIISCVCIIVWSCDNDEAPIPALDAFELLSPADGQKDVALSPEFSWTSSLDHSVTYHLSIWGDEQRAKLIDQVENIEDTLYLAAFSLAAGGSYYWTVEAENDAGDLKEARAMHSFRTEFTVVPPSPDISQYFVSPEGLDQPWAGTEEQPFKTVAYASRMVPEGEGDEIHLLPGTYLETEPIMLGLKTNLIGSGVDNTILKSEGVTLLPSTNPDASTYKEFYDGSLIQLVSEKLIPGQGAIAPADGDQKLEGFTIDGMSKKLKAGIWVENRNNVELSNLTVRDCDYRGAVVSTGNASGTKSYFLTGIKVHDCHFENSGKDLENETLGNLCLSSLDGAIINNITIDDDEGYGIKFIYRGYFKYCKFFDIVTNLNENDQKWGEKISVELWNLGPGNEVYNVHSNTWLSMVNDSEVYGEQGDQLNLLMHDIKIIDSDGQSDDRGIELAVPHAEVYNTYIENKGIAIAIWNMGRENILIRNSIFRNTSYKDNWAQGPGIYIDNSRSWSFSNIRIFNNVFDTQHFATIVKGDVMDVKISNNLIINAGIADVSNQADNSILFTHNHKSHSEQTEWVLAGSFVEDQNLLGDPMLEENGDYWESYYRPMPSSPLVNAGVDVGIMYNGSAPDIGFVELP